MKSVALETLKGIGARHLGEWHEDSPVAYHIRRRLTPVESGYTGPVVDVRGTENAKVRVEVMLKSLTGVSLPHFFYQIIEEELRGIKYERPTKNTMG